MPPSAGPMVSAPGVHLSAPPVPSIPAGTPTFERQEETIDHLKEKSSVTRECTLDPLLQDGPHQLLLVPDFLFPTHQPR